MPVDPLDFLKEPRFTSDQLIEAYVEWSHKNSKAVEAQLPFVTERAKFVTLIREVSQDFNFTEQLRDNAALGHNFTQDTAAKEIPLGKDQQYSIHRYQKLEQKMLAMKLDIETQTAYNALRASGPEGMKNADEKQYGKDEPAVAELKQFFDRYKQQHGTAPAYEDVYRITLEKIAHETQEENHIPVEKRMAILLKNNELGELGKEKYNAPEVMEAYVETAVKRLRKAQVDGTLSEHSTRETYRDLTVHQKLDSMVRLESLKDFNAGARLTREEADELGQFLKQVTSNVENRHEPNGKPTRFDDARDEAKIYGADTKDVANLKAFLTEYEQKHGKLPDPEIVMNLVVQKTQRDRGVQKQ